MKCWCRLCRAWVYEEHFLLPDGSRDGCGQGRDDIRFHPGDPLCGDVWWLRDGRHMVVDYKDPFCTGVTFSDGKRAGMKYTAGFEDFVRREEAALISTFEELPFRWCDYRGWTEPKGPKLTAENTLNFLKTVLRIEKLKAEQP